MPWGERGGGLKTYTGHEFTHTHKHYCCVMKQHYESSQRERDIVEENAVCYSYQM
jgi:hypothetical protein